MLLYIDGFSVSGPLVMKRIPRCLNASRISGLLLRGCFLYGTIFGVITYRIERKGSFLVASNRRGYRWICVVIRLLTTALYTYSYDAWAGQFVDWYFRAFFIIRLVGCLICSVIILVLQLWFGEELLLLVNSFLKLFQRLRALTNSNQVGFGDRQECILMAFKVISILFVFMAFRFVFLPWTLITMLSDFYTSVGTGMVTHLCFVGYLSIGVLYRDLNNYVDRQLRAQMISLDVESVGENPQPARVAISNLDKCLSLYEEIHLVSQRFQRIFDLPLFVSLLHSLLAMAMVSYHAILRRQYLFNLWGLVIKLLTDVVLLTMAVNSAVSGSRLVKRLSLENFYVTEDKGHHQKLELFLGGLQHRALRVCPLGLFEVSNELTLFFLSAMITYLTFLVQYGLQSQQI
ncbi:putative gustatory receptor 93b [Drosophila ficusphila]|uniref:putative gustatory receptor 93b n=1 Tax=Drosophila ficusphila TaxID=30025 RepID=UPI0007E5CC22|nr:putative gustatory receptor 93b [Drosophila ficusphila]